MLEALNSNFWVVAAYTIAAALACLSGRREQVAHRVRPTSELLPAFWFLASTLFVSMAIAHAGGFGGAVADYARQGAYADGWYEDRRSIQVVVVGAVATIWAVVTLMAIWRIPERRRRYLPMTVATTTLLCFSAIRLVSLHQVDTLLYRRSIEGLRVGVIIELCLLVVVSLVSDSTRRRALQAVTPEQEAADRAPI